MTNPALRKNVQHGLEDFDARRQRHAARGVVPQAGRRRRPPGLLDAGGVRGFVTHAVDEVQNNPALWNNTAIFVTFDEGGGYYDSGYIQPVSFFGDGTRVPMVVVSPVREARLHRHTYTDHVSILKFIERNWSCRAVERSLDNLPNPTPGAYVPTNRPAIGDLMTLFNFGRPDYATLRMATHAMPAGNVAVPVDNLQR